jgi:hypothetical protein
MEEVMARSVEGETDKDHYLVLTRIVDAVSQDHAQLRTLVYEFARRKLRRDLHRQFEEGDWSGIQERLAELEAAIDRVESDCKNRSPPLTFASEPPLTYQQIANAPLGRRQNSAVTLSGAAPPQPFPLSRYDPSALAFSEGEYHDTNPRRDKRSSSFLWWNLQLVVATLLGVAIFAVAGGQSGLDFLGSREVKQPISNAAENPDRPSQDVSAGEKAEADTPLRPRKPSFPVPSDYGVYAIAGGRLTELDLLSMRVPDPRIAISPVISTPSRTHLPTGKLEFVIFRRDLVNNAPDRVMVRVVAQVARALTFDAAGKALMTNIEDAWVVRNNSYPMRVAPVANNPEMILLRPDPPDFELPAGRYALVLKGAAYDFTLDGPITDTAHCLERTDALASAVYTECRNL